MCIRERIAVVTAVTRQTAMKLRAKVPKLSLIDQAASVAGNSRADFMLEAACEKAQQVLLEQTAFALDADRFKRFQAPLDAPVEQNEAVRKLAALAGAVGGVKRSWLHR